MDDLGVDGELAAVVRDDKDADRATARGEGAGEALPEAALVDDREASLDLTRLSHGDDVTILEVKDAVLLEDGAKHGLDDDAGGRVGDERGLLVQLLGEEVNTEVAVLASGSRGGDADDLAGAALEHQDVTHADVVARDGDGVGDGSRGGSAGALTHDLNIVVVVVVRVGEDLVSHLVQTLTDGVVLAVVVVVAHSRFLLRRRSVARILYSFLNDLGLLGVGRDGLGSVNGNTGDVDGSGRVVRDVLETVDGSTGDNGSLVGVVGRVGSGGARRVDGGTSYAEGLLVSGLGTSTVFTLDAVDAGVGGDVLAVNLDRCLSERGVGWSGLLLDTLAVNLDTGTRVMFFFAGESDLLLADALLLRRDLDRGGDRRELTFSSGLLGNADLDFLVGLCCLGFNLFLSV